MNERYKVIEVISNENLKIAGKISDTKTKLNRLIDSYKLMFEKY